MFRLYGCFTFVKHINRRPIGYSMNTGSVLGEVGNEESIIYPTGIPVDSAWVLLMVLRTVQYSPYEMFTDT